MTKYLIWIERENYYENIAEFYSRSLAADYLNYYREKYGFLLYGLSYIEELKDDIKETKNKTS